MKLSLFKKHPQSPPTDKPGKFKRSQLPIEELPEELWLMPPDGYTPSVVQIDDGLELHASAEPGRVDIDD